MDSGHGVGAFLLQGYCVSCPSEQLLAGITLQWCFVIALDQRRGCTADHRLAAGFEQVWGE